MQGRPLDPDEREAEKERRSNEATRKDPDAENRQWLKTAFESGATLEDAQSFMVDQGFCTPEFFKKEAAKYKWPTKSTAPVPPSPAAPSNAPLTPEEKKRRMIAEAVARQVTELWRRYYEGREKLFETVDAYRRADLGVRLYAAKAKQVRDYVDRQSTEWGKEDRRAEQFVRDTQKNIAVLKQSGDTSPAVRRQIHEYETSIRMTRERTAERAKRLEVARTELSELNGKHAEAERKTESARAERDAVLKRARAAEDAYQSKRYELFMTFKNPDLPDALKAWRSGKHFDERSSDD